MQILKKVVPPPGELKWDLPILANISAYGLIKLYPDLSALMKTGYLLTIILCVCLWFRVQKARVPALIVFGTLALYFAVLLIVKFAMFRVALLFIFLYMFWQVKKWKVLNPSFKDWVKHPELKEELFQDIMESQSRQHKEDEKNKEIKNDISSMDAQSVIEKMKGNKNEYYFSSAVKRLVFLGDINYFIQCIEFIGKASYNVWAGCYEALVLRENKIVKEFDRKLYHYMVELVLSEPNKGNTGLFKCMLWIDEKESINLLTDEKNLSCNNKKLHGILEALNHFKIQLSQANIIRLLEQASKIICEIDEKNKSENVNLCNLPIDLLNMLKWIDSEESAKWAKTFLEMGNIDGYNAWDLAKLYCELKGFPNPGKYLEANLFVTIKSDSMEDFKAGNKYARIYLTILNLDGQVCNGGWSQYFANGYGYQIEMALEGMLAIGDQSAAAVTSKVIDEMNDYGKHGDFSEEKMGQYFEELNPLLDKYDSEYYSSKTSVLKKLTLYLLNNKEEIIKDSKCLSLNKPNLVVPKS